MIDCNTDPGRPVGMLLNLYKNPQKGESKKLQEDAKQQQRLYERLNYVNYVAEELNIKNHRKRIRHIIKNLDSLNDLCKRCKWQTIVIAIAFYVKCYYHNCKTSQIHRYKVCRENDLTLSTYSMIVTRLAAQFQTNIYLSPLCPTEKVKNSSMLM
jgi:hypothetical protein